MLRSTKVFLLLFHLSVTARLISVHIVCTFLLLSFTPQNSWSLRRTSAISVLTEDAKMNSHQALEPKSL